MHFRIIARANMCVVEKVGIFSKLFRNKDSDLDERLKQITFALRKKGIEQSRERKLDIAVEAKRIGYLCGIIGIEMVRKQHHPRYFVDVALCLLCYPPELGFFVATQLSSFAPSLGWNPFGTTMVALGMINQLCSSAMLLVKKRMFNEMPDLFELINNRQLRTQKAGRFLAISLLIAALNIKDARKVYSGSTRTCEESVKKALDEELVKYDAEIAHKIMMK